MFLLTYLHHELRHRSRQAALIAVGLAVGVGLVITTAAASSAMSRAQASVLHSLSGIGTDITVTAKPQGAGKGPGNPVPTSKNGVALPTRGQLLDASAVDAIAHVRQVARVSDSLTLTEIELPHARSAVPTITRIDAIDVHRLGNGPYASATLRSGRSLRPSDAHADVAVLDTRYAAAHRLHVGSKITIADTRLTVIGIVDQPTTGAASIYIPLALGQTLGTDHDGHRLTGKVSTIYVSASAASEISGVEAEIAALIPSASLTDNRQLAKAVSGSLTSATTLAHHLGTWLTIGVLLATAATAALLNLAATNQRVREIGTLKALGWSSHRIIAQVLAESGAVGAAGAALGIAIGILGVAIVNAATPPLTATVASSQDAKPGGGLASVTVHLQAHTALAPVIVATLLAFATAVVAGAIAAWRTTQLRPAHALASIE